MLWYKAWLETRWRFVIGLALVVCSVIATVFAYPRLMQLAAGLTPTGGGGALGRAVREGIDLARSFRGYAWAQIFRQNIANLWTLFAVMIGTGGLLSQASGGAALYSLSMPVSRKSLLLSRAGIGLAELLVLALIPAVLLPLLAPAIGESYSLTEGLVHSLCLFIAGAVFFSLAFLLSTVFGDIWRPLLLPLVAAMVFGFVEQVADDVPFGIFRVMSGETYFQSGAVPWLGLLATAAISAALLWTAIANLGRRDF